jgi:Flp pilus assembly protein TadB
MNTLIIPSTLLLTLLMLVGLFFFIRASVKDRTQEIKLVSEQAEASLVVELQQYFQERSYKVAQVDPEQNSVTFEGIVRPSIFLAIFLTLLAVAGILCLWLVLSLLFPSLSSIFLWLVLLSPAAGFFYWKRAGRKEQVLLKMEATKNKLQSPSKITVIAHRDELIELQRALQLTPCE